MALKTQNKKPTSLPDTHTAANAGLIELQIDYRSISDLKLDARNPRQHPQRQINQLADSIREFGFVMPIVADNEGNVVIGHGRMLAAKKLGMLRVPVIELRHLSAGQLKAFRIADNRLAQHAHWDERLLGEDFLELNKLDPDFDLSITGFNLPEIDVAIQRLTETSVEEIAVTSSNTGVPVCQVGDLWQLGPHRVYCGDAKSDLSFAELMEGMRADIVFVDPPYNVRIEGHVSGKGKTRHREFC